MDQTDEFVASLLIVRQSASHYNICSRQNEQALKKCNLKLSAVGEHPDLVNKILDGTQMRTGVRRAKKKRWGLLVFGVDGPLLFQATGQKKAPLSGGGRE